MQVGSPRLKLHRSHLESPSKLYTALLARTEARGTAPGPQALKAVPMDTGGSRCKMPHEEEAKPPLLGDAKLTS